MYELERMNGKPMEGNYYSGDLIKVDKPREYLISKILRRRGKGKDAQVLVSFLGYEKEEPEWISASAVRDL